LGKILPLGAVFALDVLLMALVAGFALGVWPQGNILFFLVVSTFYVLVSLALGLLFSATSSTAAEAVQKTVVFSIPLVQLSGFAFPIRNMPAFFRWLTELFPATHYIRLSRAIYLRAEGPTALLPEIGFLVLFGAVLIVLALRSLEKALVFLAIPKSFRRDVERGRPAVQLLLDGSDPLSAARVGVYIGQVATAFETRAAPRDPPDADMPVPQPGPIETRQRFWFNPTLQDRAFFLAALGGMLLTNLCLSAMSLGLVGERETGTYEQMLALPTTAIEIVLGKLVPYVGVAYALMLMATIAAGAVFGLWPHGSWLALLVVTLPYVLA